MRVQTFVNRAAAAQACAAALAEAAQTALSEGRRARLALSGGSSPEPAYQRFAQADLDWSRVDLALADERWVEPSDPGSNEGLLRRCFGTVGATIAPMKTEHASPSQASDAVSEAYARLIPFDALLLGMGTDGHTLSWFPGAQGLQAAMDAGQDRWVAPIYADYAANSGHPWRMTLTAPAIARARALILLIQGAEKRAAFERGLALGDVPIAAALKLSRNPLVLWSP